MEQNDGSIPRPGDHNRPPSPEAGAPHGHTNQNDPHAGYPQYDPRGAYHGMSYPLPPNVESEVTTQRNLLDGTKLSTREALLFAIALSGAVATGYVNLSTVQNDIDKLTDTNTALTITVKEMESEYKLLHEKNRLLVRSQEDAFELELGSISTTVSSLKESFNSHDNSTDRRFEDLEERVAGLVFRSRRDKSKTTP